MAEFTVHECIQWLDGALKLDQAPDLRPQLEVETLKGSWHEAIVVLLADALILCQVIPQRPEDLRYSLPPQFSADHPDFRIRLAVLADLQALLLAASREVRESTIKAKAMGRIFVSKARLAPDGSEKEFRNTVVIEMLKKIAHITHEVADVSQIELYRHQQNMQRRKE